MSATCYELHTPKIQVSVLVFGFSTNAESLLWPEGPVATNIQLTLFKETCLEGGRVSCKENNGDEYHVY
jgi:hypothetical protein